MDIQLLTDYEKTHLADRQPFRSSSSASGTGTRPAIAAAKSALGDRLVILGHRSSVMRSSVSPTPLATR